MNIVQAGERTRLVLNLVRGMNFTTRLDGKSLYVMLSPIGRVSDSSAQRRSAMFAEESVVGAKHALRDVLFRRGKDGEGSAEHLRSKLVRAGLKAWVELPPGVVGDWNEAAGQAPVMPPGLAPSRPASGSDLASAERREGGLEGVRQGAG